MGMRSCAALLVFAAARASALAVQTAEGERHELAPPEGVVSAAATTSGGEALENAHAPFTNELHRVRMSLTDVTRDVEVVEQEGPSVVPASDLRQHMENALHEIEQVSRAPQTLFHHYYLCPCSTRGFAAAQGIASLQRVRRDVEASDRLAPTVKTQVRTGSLMHSKQPPHRPLKNSLQVLWDLDKMTEDVQRLHASGLAPNGRAALLKALQLRFAVLLSPSFWRAPIRRSLISL